MAASYKVNEIFYSLQGEGRWTGFPMIFVRFSLCNLRCPFCDTDFSKSIVMSGEEILSEVRRLGGTCRRICLTGGEPSLQVDQDIVDLLHSAGYLLHMETNGTHTLPDGLDWVTMSPKQDWNPKAVPAIDSADELKLVYTGQDVSPWLAFPAKWHLLQPCSGKNVKDVAAYCQAHPEWSLSLQTHLLLHIR